MLLGGSLEKASLLEAVEAIIKSIEMELESSKQPAETESMDVDNANQPEWKTWIIKSCRAIKDFKKGSPSEQDENRISEHTRMKDYLKEVLGLLKEKKAKTWNQLHPDVDRNESNRNNRNNESKQQKPIPFKVWTSTWWSTPIPEEKVPLYEELYEACWNGDDDKIRELCLPPPEGTTRKVAPIQIVCMMVEGGERCFNSTLVWFNINASAYRVHTAACCDPSSSLVDSEHCPDDRCRPAKDKA